MIGIGINENAILAKAEQEEKGALSLTFDEVANLSKPVVSVFDSLQTAKVENDGRTGIKVNMFPFKKPSGPKNDEKTDDERLEMTSEDMKKVKNQLTQLLEVYLVTDKIQWDPFINTGVTTDNWREKFGDNDVLRAIFDNYTSQFINMITPYLGKVDQPFRLKLVRTSKEKHYATIPGRFLAESPYVESMDVPLATTRVKWSKWELDNKLNDPTPLSKPAAPDSQIPDSTSEENVFGQR